MSRKGNNKPNTIVTTSNDFNSSVSSPQLHSSALQSNQMMPQMTNLIEDNVSQANFAQHNPGQGGYSQFNSGMQFGQDAFQKQTQFGMPGQNFGMNQQQVMPMNTGGFQQKQQLVVDKVDGNKMLNNCNLHEILCAAHEKANNPENRNIVVVSEIEKLLKILNGTIPFRSSHSMSKNRFRGGNSKNRMYGNSSKERSFGGNQHHSNGYNGHGMNQFPGGNRVSY